MKQGAYFINIARGCCVVTQDLIDAPRSGRLAGAGLDVADPEPLPDDSQLWSMRSVLITPHVAIYGTPYRDKREALWSRTADAVPPAGRCSTSSTSRTELVLSLPRSG